MDPCPTLPCSSGFSGEGNMRVFVHACVQGRRRHRTRRLFCFVDAARRQLDLRRGYCQVLLDRRRASIQQPPRGRPKLHVVRIKTDHLAERSKVAGHYRHPTGRTAPLSAAQNELRSRIRLRWFDYTIIIVVVVINLLFFYYYCIIILLFSLLLFLFYKFFCSSAFSESYTFNIFPLFFVSYSLLVPSVVISNLPYVVLFFLLLIFRGFVF